jgi:hypothetical protein
MINRACALTVLVGSLLSAGCDTDSMSARDIAGSYTLVRVGSNTPPFTMTYEKIGVPGVMCVDTTFAQLLHVHADGTATHETQQTEYCPADDPADRGFSLPGTWRLHGDSFHVRLTGPSLDGPTSAEFGAVVEGDEIMFRNPAGGDATGAGSVEQVYRRVR